LIATITGTDQFGGTYNYVFGDDASENVAGENFFFAATDSLQSIRQISFSSSGGGFADVRQVRVGPAAMTTAVPEPGTWAMMLVGFGAMGVAMRRRRRDAMLTQMA
jgi:hypothetical protein